MVRSELHTFHIPVLGLGYTVDTPVKVAKFGISSVVSIIEDGLVERMRKYHSHLEGEEYVPIEPNDYDSRARRITEYLNLLNRIVNRQINDLRKLPFEAGNDLVKYFEMLPDTSPVRNLYDQMCGMEEGELKSKTQEQLKNKIRAGAIDVNIMAKIDRLNTDKNGEPLPAEFSDALAAFRGYAMSDLSSSVVFSAGYNPRLYNYVEKFPDFFPDENGNFKKKVVLKVSDFRSAMVQGKILAKKGIWISEFRIESGLNCGGHAFPTDGVLLGPILHEFSEKRYELADELFSICSGALQAKGITSFVKTPHLRITVQGGIGTANENQFLFDQYDVDSTGWGSPFLLVPEVTNVDDVTLHQLANAKKEDYFVSYASPLGIPFNNFKPSSAEHQRVLRIDKGRPGSPCYKKFLSTDTEFTASAICTASRQYQDLKIKQLNEKGLSELEYNREFKSITDKDCLCEGLCASALLKSDIPVPHNLSAVTICPGPNLAYFSGVLSLMEMVNHIYGRLNLLNSLNRENMFINELQLYIDHFTELIDKSLDEVNLKQTKYLNTFKANLLDGISYYKKISHSFKREKQEYINKMKTELDKHRIFLENLIIPVPVTAKA